MVVTILLHLRVSHVSLKRRKCPNRQSPRTSTPSVDSAVGSAEGLGVPHQSNLEEIRPRSDGSDSLATSSALTSPEPPVPEVHEQQPRLELQTDASPTEVIPSEPIYQVVDSTPIDEIVQKGQVSYISKYLTTERMT
ncbi:hypothetical protein HZH68_006858 [Vespula germanica]|uniref:Uncharacterized protein n=1 Tax=Vespula germanica TaxID=30212 RepID=A0A836UVK2_VESGE|nr:hypothetical protein HZH68_006858 [Vespula germanica]